MPGVDPVIATVIVATIGNVAAFRKGRDIAAWLGVVPEDLVIEEHVVFHRFELSPVAPSQ
jgi:hypothetical protein